MKKTVDEKCTQQIFALRAKNESNEKWVKSGGVESERLHIL